MHKQFDSKFVSAIFNAMNFVLRKEHKNIKSISNSNYVENIKIFDFVVERIINAIATNTRIIVVTKEDVANKFVTGKINKTKFIEDNFNYIYDFFVIRGFDIKKIYSRGKISSLVIVIC